jgi:hypothetical protein
VFVEAVVEIDCTVAEVLVVAAAALVASYIEEYIETVEDALAFLAFVAAAADADADAAAVGLANMN